MNIQQPLLPPDKHINRAECHWVHKIDSDGRSTGHDVWRWQPGLRKWCRPNEYATGQGDELIGYKWIAVCPAPMFREEAQDLKIFFEQKRKELVGGKVTISEEELKLLTLYFFENLIEQVIEN